MGIAERLYLGDAGREVSAGPEGYIEPRGVRWRSLTGMSGNSTEPRSASAFDAHHAPAREIIDKCVHCGFCLPVCPTYVLWGQEMDSPRGRIYLMKMAADGKVEMNTEWVSHFDSCLGCMACMPACPSGVDYGKLIEATRAQIERGYTRPATTKLHRKLCIDVQNDSSHSMSLLLVSRGLLGLVLILFINFK